MTPKQAYENANEFWTTHNKNFVDDAISGSDDIILTHNPNDLQNLFYKKGNQFIDVNGNPISIQLTGTIQNQITQLKNANAFQTMFGREMEYLKSKGINVSQFYLQ